MTKKELLIERGIAEFARVCYADANTDTITADCGVSKGLLFHYFSSKSGFYTACLEEALLRLTQGAEGECAADGSFFDVLFASVDAKLRLCASLPNETHFANMASRETACEVNEQRAALIAAHMARVQTASAGVMASAFAKLDVAREKRALALDAMRIYASAIVSMYLSRYNDRPDAFFANADAIKGEMREYLSLMLDGIRERGNGI